MKYKCISLLNDCIRNFLRRKCTENNEVTVHPYKYWRIFLNAFALKMQFIPYGHSKVRNTHCQQKKKKIKKAPSIFLDTGNHSIL